MADSPVVLWQSLGEEDGGGAGLHWNKRCVLVYVYEYVCPSMPVREWGKLLKWSWVPLPWVSLGNLPSHKSSWENLDEENDWRLICFTSTSTVSVSECPESSSAIDKAVEEDCHCTGRLSGVKLVVCGNGMLLKKGWSFHTFWREVRINVKTFTFIYVATLHVVRFCFQVHSRRNTGPMLWLGLGTKVTWLWLAIHHVLVQNDCFGCHKQAENVLVSCKKQMVFCSRCPEVLLKSTQFHCHEQFWRRLVVIHPLLPKTHIDWFVTSNSTTIPSIRWHESQGVNMYCKPFITRFADVSVLYVAYNPNKCEAMCGLWKH